ncbi:MAG TPA: heparan-alpha-glucosaminide N-acetyltransferase domain-containing protein [Rhizomicrobium sp.]|nr:heparan-alpha-glucosaminide N-acetyltransferase domain-containing protein [Rhizomicrobium sp.]
MAEDSMNRARIESIDLVRGIIIVIMALDHSHDFFGSLTAQPTNTATTTAALFFTRWITHFCAPVFFLLTGTSASLTRKRISKPALSRFLVTRGVWLILLEIVVLRFALQFNFDYHVTILTVLWALGWVMIALAALIWLPIWAIAAFGIVLIAGHNALDGIDASRFGAWAPLWIILHQPGLLLNTGHSAVFVAYALVPWIGVTAMGYVLGETWRWNAGPRRAVLFWTGIALVIGFVALRHTNLYGDPLHWVVRKTPLFTGMSFINTVKYPPSLLFLMMTLGPALLLLRAFDGGVPWCLRPAHTIGRVPLFFFVLHFYLIHLLAVAACWWRYGTVANMFQSPDIAHFPFTAPPGWDFGLPVVYAVWVFVIVSLCPLCRWYAGVRRRHDWWWLSYL